MQSYKKSKTLIPWLMTVAGILFFLGLPIERAVAIGMITNPIEITDALRGQEVPSELLLYNSSPEAETYQLRSEGQTATWTTFYIAEDKEFTNPVTEITVPAESNIPAKVLFKIPSDVKNGTYDGVIYMSFMPETKEPQKNAVTVGQRVSRLVKITVSDTQNLKLVSSLIPEKYQYRVGEPVIIRTIFQNQGNVGIKPTLQLKIIKDENQIFNAIFPYPENAGEVKPLQSKEFADFAIWETGGQTPGKYVMQMTVLLDGKINKTEPFTFSIISNNALMASSFSSIVGQNMTVISLLAGMGLLLVLLMVVLAVKHKRVVG